MTQTRRPSSQNRPRVSRPGPGGLRFGMFAVCVTRDSDPGLNKGKAKNLYHLLITYSDVSSRNTAQGYPYRSALADALDCTKDTVDNATKYLEQEIGLIRVVRRKVEGQPDQNDANEYQVFDQWLIQGCEPTPDTPPQLVARYGPTIPGFDVDVWIAAHAPSFDLEGWRAAYEEKLRAQEAKRGEQRRKEALRRKPKRRGGSGTDSATRGGTESATGGGMSAALSRAGSPEPSSRDDAPSARSAADGRQASTGSRGSSSGGSAASSNNKPTFSREQRRQYDAFVAALPAPLKALVPNGLPKPLVEAVLAATDHASPEGRTVEQLIEYRLMPKWHKHYSSAALAGWIQKPVGALVAMLRRDAECGDDRCDERTNVDTGQPCISCEQRAVNKRAERAAEQAAKAPERPSMRSERPAAPPPRKTPAKRPERAVPPPREVSMTEVSDQQRALARAAVLVNRGRNRASRMP